MRLPGTIVVGASPAPRPMGQSAAAGAIIEAAARSVAGYDLQSGAVPLVDASRAAPCPVCGKPDWCGVRADGSAAICMRTESPWPTKNGGWLHILSNAPHRRRPRIEPRKEAPPPPDLRPVILAAQQNTLPNVIAWHASELGLPTDAGVDALGRLLAHTPRYDVDAVLRLWPRTDEDAARLRGQLDWLNREAAGWLAFAMHCRNRIVGVRLRHVQGRKLALVGGHEGLFIPNDLSPRADLLCIVEGATDCAAVLAVGLPAIGRPSCRGAVDETLRLALTLRPRRVAVLLDNDKPGIEGGAALAKLLGAVVGDVRCVLPPRGVKDVRQWITQGARKRDILDSIEGGRRV